MVFVSGMFIATKHATRRNGVILMLSMALGIGVAMEPHLFEGGGVPDLPFFAETYGRRLCGCTSSRMRRWYLILRWTISFPARRDHFMTLRRVYMSSWQIGCCSRSRGTGTARASSRLAG